MTDYPALCLVEIERVREASRRFGDRFTGRLFTENELSYCLPRAARLQHLACRLAAKVAVRKAMRAAGLTPPAWKEIEVQRDEWGKPSIDVARPDNRFSIIISLSHSRLHAVASVILTRSRGIRDTRGVRD